MSHGLSYSRVYRIWIGMKGRCLNPNHPKYSKYGAAGISVCDRWMSFENFLSDMGHPPSDQHSLDRYPDGSGDYDPSNCRWATKREQSANTHTALRITFQGQTHPLNEWARILGIPDSTLWNRLNRAGMTVEEAFAIQKGKHHRRRGLPQ